MAKFGVSVPHKLERGEAVSRLRKFSEFVKNDLPVDVTEIQETWDDEGNLDFAFSAMGFKISGQMMASDDQVKVDGQLPFAALPFRGTIENQVSQMIAKALA